MNGGEDMIMLLTTIAGGAMGGALIGLIQFLIQRKDAKADKHDDVMNAINKLTEEVQDIRHDQRERDAVLARTHILRFNDELYNGIHHTREYFDQTIDDIKTYEKFCEENPEFSNGRTEQASVFIRDEYERLYKERKL